MAHHALMIYEYFTLAIGVTLGEGATPTNKLFGAHSDLFGYMYYVYTHYIVEFIFVKVQFPCSVKQWNSTTASSFR